MNIKELVKNKQVIFEYYRDSKLYYSVQGTDFIFPVPTDPKEIGNATFNRCDKAILFMRYIRKYLKDIEDDSK